MTLDRARRLLPWASLAMGVVTAATMNRSPERAGWIGALALCGLVAAVVFAIRASRPATSVLAAAAGPAAQGVSAPAADLAALARSARWQSAARRLALGATQSLLQAGLLFSLPFYADAASFDGPQLAFFAGLAATLAIVAWDPWCHAALARTGGALALAAVSSFITLNAVLPMLGVSNRESLVASASAAGVALTLWRVLAAPSLWKRLRAATLGLALTAAAAAALAGGPLARLVPPAPMSLAAIQVGTRIENRAVADPGAEFTAPLQLACASAIHAPRGVRDALIHVWLHDGRVVDRIAVAVAGGRAAGFRTWSIKRELGADSGGQWTCAVETAAGQRLGARTVRVYPSPPWCVAKNPNASREAASETIPAAPLQREPDPPR